MLRVSSKTALSRVPTKTKITPPTKGRPFKQTRRTHTRTWHPELPPNPPPRQHKQEARCSLSRSIIVEVGCPSQAEKITSVKTPNLFTSGRGGDRVSSRETGREKVPYLSCPPCHHLSDTASVCTCNPNAKEGPDEHRTHWCTLSTACSQGTWMYPHSTCQAWVRSFLLGGCFLQGHELPSALSMAVESQGKQDGVGTISHMFIRYPLGGRNVLNPRDATAIKSDAAPAFTELTGQ